MAVVYGHLFSIKWGSEVSSDALSEGPTEEWLLSLRVTKIP